MTAYGPAHAQARRILVQTCGDTITWSCGCRTWSVRIENRYEWREHRCRRHGGRDDA